MVFRHGTFNSAGQVQGMADQIREQNAKGTFNLYPKINEASGNRGQRQHPLGSFQGGGSLGRQNYDVRYNVHICKKLIQFWGRNAYSSDATKGGGPIEVVHGGTTYEVYCHIDITTPRDNYLWHGGVEGPHVVIENYKVKGSAQVQNVDDDCFWLSPDDVFKLYVWERDHNQNRAPGVARTWPVWLKQRLIDRIVTKLAAIQNRGQGGNVWSDDEEDLGFGLFG